MDQVTIEQLTLFTAFAAIIWPHGLKLEEFQKENDEKR